jgi:hypothetical protein
MFNEKALFCVFKLHPLLISFLFLRPTLINILLPPSYEEPFSFIFPFPFFLSPSSLLTALFSHPIFQLNGEEKEANSFSFHKKH